jgi:hypothetical protein
MIVISYFTNLLLACLRRKSNIPGTDVMILKILAFLTENKAN